ncbi:Crp/Fnr family transcriptional regulator [Gracilibacillus halotolerans]|uniref:Crp/Fnr family transcriptional regulator n=1 Tax=Gracilibacillus halotolerans TaxID=74386 RepID=UPI003CCCB099
MGETETQATSVAIETVDKRIAQYLINNANENEEVILQMTRKELASYLGTTPETISRKLTEFEEKGYIIQKTSRKIEILKVDELM